MIWPGSGSGAWCTLGSSPMPPIPLLPPPHPTVGQVQPTVPWQAFWSSALLARNNYTAGELQGQEFLAATEAWHLSINTCPRSACLISPGMAWGCQLPRGGWSRTHLPSTSKLFSVPKNIEFTPRDRGFQTSQPGLRACALCPALMNIRVICRSSHHLCPSSPPNLPQHPDVISQG